MSNVTLKGEGKSRSSKLSRQLLHRLQQNRCICRQRHLAWEFFFSSVSFLMSFLDETIKPVYVRILLITAVPYPVRTYFIVASALSKVVLPALSFDTWQPAGTVAQEDHPSNGGSMATNRAEFASWMTSSAVNLGKNLAGMSNQLCKRGAFQTSLDVVVEILYQMLRGPRVPQGEGAKCGG